MRAAALSNLLPNHGRRAHNWIYSPRKDKPLAKPNYQFEKRQKELAKKKKKEEKRLRKLAENPAAPAETPQENPVQPPGGGETT